MSKTDETETRRRKRALYRAEHRGSKEMDWLLGRFAAAEVAQMSLDQLSMFEQVLALPDPDLEQWITSPTVDRPSGEIGAFIMHLRRFHGLET